MVGRPAGWANRAAARRLGPFGGRPWIVFAIWPPLMAWLLLASLPHVRSIGGVVYLTVLSVAGLLAGLDMARRAARSEASGAAAAEPTPPADTGATIADRRCG